MKVIHISTSDCGGAGKAAFRLHLALRLIGIDSKMLVLYHRTSDKYVVQFEPNESIFKRMLNELRNKTINRDYQKNTHSKTPEMFSDDRTIYDICKHPLIQEADIVHMHWVAGMINYTGFFPKIFHKSIVWTLHDMNPFTGGCHYSWNCEKYKDICDACPQLGTNSLNDLSKKIWTRKKKSYIRSDIHVVTPSKWMANCAGSSQLFHNFTVDVIPNGLSISLFTKRKKKYARDLLHLPKDKTLILFEAQSLNNIRKGVWFTKKILSSLKREFDISKLGLVILGNHTNQQIIDDEYSVYPLGTIYDELLLSICYSAADFFIIPALEDNFPNTVLESMACGTPVIGFNVGGIPDIVKHGESGLLAQVKNNEELTGHVMWMVNHPEKCLQMGVNARKIVEKECSSEKQAKRYYQLYQSIKTRYNIRSNSL